MASRTDTAQAFAIIVGVGLVGWLVFQARSKAGEALEAINPLERGNFINRGATTVFQNAADTQLTIGEQFFKTFNPDEAESLCKAGQTKFCTNSGSKPVKMPTGFAAGGLSKFQGVIVN